MSTPTPDFNKIVAFKLTYKRLVIAARHLRQTLKSLRYHTQQIAGCDITDWTDEDVEKYAIEVSRRYSVAPKKLVRQMAGKR